MISTELLHKNHHNNDFYGPFKKYRAMMDSTYFCNYTKERQELQDTIIKKYLTLQPNQEIPKDRENRDNREPKITLSKSQSNMNPWIFFTCGPFGAGKTHSLRYLHDQKVLDLNEYVHIDPDKLKYELPEATSYIQADPINAGTNLHKESTFLSLMIQYIVLDQGRPMIIDGSLRNLNWNLEHMLNIRKKYPQYNLGIIKVEADIPTMLNRAQKRAAITGRIVPDNLIVSTANDIKDSFPQYLKMCNIYLIVDNNYEPRINRICIVNPDIQSKL